MNNLLIRIVELGPLRVAYTHAFSKTPGQDAWYKLKAQESASYILGTRTELDSGEPKLVLHRTDSEAIRSRILSMTLADARKRGIRKNTLWYLQRRAKTEKSFRIYDKTESKLSQSMT